MTIHALIDAPSKRIKQLESVVEKQLLRIDRLRSGKRTSFKKATTRRSRNGFLRVIFGDVHGAYADAPAVQAFLADMRELKPKELVCVGDILSCDGFLAEHHTISVVSQLDYTYEQDTQVANEFLDKLADATSNAPLRLIEGNHEAHIQRTIAKLARHNPFDARYLERLFGVGAVLSLKSRGIEFIRRYEYYDGLSVSGTIKLDPHALAQHGEAYCGVNASRSLLSALGKSVFHGHTHRLKVEYGENISAVLVAINTGSLCQKRPLYGLTKTTGWCHGYALEFVEPGHGFLALPVPIIGGVSYLSPLMRVLRNK